MKISHLAEFVEIAKAPSISEAARSMHYTHQAMSRHLEEMERELGCTLVTRGTPITLTPSGKTLLRTASNIVREFDSVTQQLRQMQAGVSGTVRILVYDYIPFSWYMSKIIASTQEKHPNVNVVFQKAVRITSAQALRNDKVDIGFWLQISLNAPGSAPEDPEFEYTKIAGYADRLYFVVSKAHPLANRHMEPISLAELCAYPIVVPSFNSRSMFPLAFESFLQEQGLKPSYEYVACESMDEYYIKISDEGVYPLSDTFGLHTVIPKTFSDSVVRIEPAESPIVIEAYLMTIKDAPKPTTRLFLEEFLLSLG